MWTNLLEEIPVPAGQWPMTHPESKGGGFLEEA